MASHILFFILCFHGFFLILVLAVDLQLEASGIPNQPSASPYPFLKDVLKSISSKYRWKAEEARVSKFDFETAMFATFCNFEFLVLLDKSSHLLKFSRKQKRWRKYVVGEADFRFIVRELNQLSVLDNLRIEGPAELNVISNGDELSISLPQNSSYSGLRRIIVGEGITIEVNGAREVVLLQHLDIGFLTRGSSIPFWSSFCLAIPPVKISGSASLFAYKNQTPEARIAVILSNKKTIELLPDKCHWNPSPCRIDILSSWVDVVERVMADVGDKFQQKGAMSITKAGVRASTIVRFRLEVERVVGMNQSSVEQRWFEVVAVVEAATLKPMLVNKVDDFVVANSVAWSKVMKNVSFTQLRYALDTSASLTLGVQW